MRLLRIFRGGGGGALQNEARFARLKIEAEYFGVELQFPRFGHGKTYSELPADGKMPKGYSQVICRGCRSAKFQYCSDDVKTFTCLSCRGEQDAEDSLKK